MARSHNERCPNCKKNVRDLLSALFGCAESNYDLDLPASLTCYQGTGAYDSLERVHSALQRYRRFENFVRSRKLPRVDFYVPRKALIVEFDESQHFTKPREIALSHYPNGHGIGFSLERWRGLCVALQKQDNDPPFRDEQRAWYDTLRDFAPIVCGKGQTLRLYARDQQWCSLRPNDSNDLKRFRRTMSLHASNNKRSPTREKRPKKRSDPPDLDIRKLGIISRDYRSRFQNRYRDFSCKLAPVLNLLDANECDAALFSLYSIIPRRGFNVRQALRGLRHMRAVFLEEFSDGRKRKSKRFVVYHRSENQWHEYELEQKFGSLTGTSRDGLRSFVADEMPRRLLGNCCVLLCGESNGVRWSRDRRRVEDTFGLRKCIRKEVNLILNPVHDRMTRYEMNLKRAFLSKNGRWVISVWNKGRTDERGRTMDGCDPAWAIFHNGRARKVKPMPNQLGLEVGLLDLHTRPLGDQSRAPAD